ncbi:MAG: glycosyltransferase family 4 protein [Rhodothermales bacterium]|nr:glycosyltransferase family 4 protein [Rhodothermales bacterium]
MKIGHYSPTIFAHGGIGQYIQRLGDAQQSRGHDVVYFSKNNSEAAQCTIAPTDRDLFSLAKGAGLDILHLHKEVASVPPPDLHVVRTMHGNQASCPSGSRYLSRRGTQCDRTYSAIGCFWGHVVDGCGSSKPERMKAHFARIKKEKTVLPHIQTLTVSEFLRQRMIIEGYPASHVQTLLSPAPVVSESASIPENDLPHFVFLGRLVPQKGIDWLIRSLLQVKSECLVEIAGDGYFAEEAKAMADRLGVASKVRFLGWVDAPTAARTIQKSRAVIFPSVWHEPAGLVTLEAAAHARPVITAAVGGIPEYADPSFSIVLEPHDETALAAAIDRFCDDKKLADSMGRAGYEYVTQNHSFDGFCDSLSDIYTQIIDVN